MISTEAAIPNRRDKCLKFLPFQFTRIPRVLFLFFRIALWPGGISFIHILSLSLSLSFIYQMAMNADSFNTPIAHLTLLQGSTVQSIFPFLDCIICIFCVSCFLFLCPILLILCQIHHHKYVLSSCSLSFRNVHYFHCQVHHLNFLRYQLSNFDCVSWGITTI